MAGATLQLIRDDGVRVPAFRINPLHRSGTVRAALSVMVAEADTAFAHRLLFTMQDGSRVVAKARAARAKVGV